MLNVLYLFPFESRWQHPLAEAKMAETKTVAEGTKRVLSQTT